MPTTLKQIGDMAMAMYYQNYKSDDQFFDLAHFKFLAVNKYTELINDEANSNKLQNRGLTGFSFMEISSEWLIEETLKLQRDNKKNYHYVETERTPFPFDYDAMGSAVQYVSLVGNQCGELKRMAITDKWQLCGLPATSTIFYYVEKNRIIFPNLTCNVKEIEVQYVPLVECSDDNSAMHEDKVHDIIALTLNLMFGARQGTMVDMSNNSNPNIVPAGEIDPNAGK